MPVPSAVLRRRFLLSLTGCFPAGILAASLSVFGLAQLGPRGQQERTFLSQSPDPEKSDFATKTTGRFVDFDFFHVSDEISVE